MNWTCAESPSGASTGWHCFCLQSTGFRRLRFLALRPSASLRRSTTYFRRASSIHLRSPPHLEASAEFRVLVPSQPLRHDRQLICHHASAQKLTPCRHDVQRPRPAPDCAIARKVRPVTTLPGRVRVVSWFRWSHRTCLDHASPWRTSAHTAGAWWRVRNRPCRYRQVASRLLLQDRMALLHNLAIGSDTSTMTNT